ncbi:MAG: hypothetical protein JW832_06150 [Deltaproteobacteria bacterium]|nr:hypothetical protein [Deltaproteobacteria bacterium]
MKQSKESLQKKLADLEKPYVAFLCEQFAGWRGFADATQRLIEGKEVSPKECPESYLHEFRMLKEVLAMDATGSFDWNNPVLRESFAHMAASPFYRLWGKTIAQTALRLAKEAGIETLVEIGAGRGHMTGIMLDHMKADGCSLPLVVTDAAPAVLEPLKKLAADHPQNPMRTLQWDITQPPPQALLDAVRRPCLIYERASIMYSNIPAIENLASVADIVVFGDMFNYTGDLYAYDSISEKIGGKPLFYSQIRPLMEKHFSGHFFFDLRAQEALGYPSTTILIGWR